MVKFLIIRFSSIGDIVLTSPVVRMLKQQVEGAEIHFLTKSQYADVINNNPYITKVWTFENNFSQLSKELKYQHFDYIIDLHNNLRSRRFINSIKAISFSFKKLNIEKWLLVNFNINKLPDIHIVDRYLETIKVFDIKNDLAGLDFFIPEKTEYKLPENFSESFYVFAIGANHSTKRLPANRIIEIIDSIDSPVLILGGKSERDEALQIIEKTKAKAFNACGVFTLYQSAKAIKDAKFVISHDTGMMHIAAAYKKRIISVWGNTIPEFGMYPYLSDPDSKIFEVKNLKCRPCSKIGFSRCPKKHFDCMEKQDFDTIAEAAKSFFNL